MIKVLRKKSEKQPQITKYLGVMLTKEVKDLYDKNIKSLKKETEEDIRKWRDLPCSCIGRINIIKVAILSKAIYRSNTIPIKIPTQFFTDLKRTIYNFIWKNKKPKITKTILHKKGTSRASPSLTSSSTTIEL